MKIGGDAHTDAALKAQFALLAMIGLALLLGLVWSPAILLAVAALLMFLGTTGAFVRWAWSRDRWVALIWPGVTMLRVGVQGCGLAIGLLKHGLISKILKK